MRAPRTTPRPTQAWLAPEREGFAEDWAIGQRPTSGANSVGILRVCRRRVERDEDNIESSNARVAVSWLSKTLSIVRIGDNIRSRCTSKERKSLGAGLGHRGRGPWLARHARGQRDFERRVATRKRVLELSLQQLRDRHRHGRRLRHAPRADASVTRLSGRVSWQTLHTTLTPPTTLTKRSASPSTAPRAPEMGGGVHRRTTARARISSPRLAPWRRWRVGARTARASSPWVHSCF